MSERSLLALCGVLVAGAVVMLAAWATRGSRDLPPLPEASDQVVMDFALGQLKAGAREAVLQCGAALANQAFDAKVRIGTVAEGTRVLGFELTTSGLDATQAACVTEAFTAQRGRREGKFKDRIPAGREYELDTHLVLPQPTAAYTP